MLLKEHNIVTWRVLEPLDDVGRSQTVSPCKE